MTKVLPTVAYPASRIRLSMSVRDEFRASRAKWPRHFEARFAKLYGRRARVERTVPLSDSGGDSGARTRSLRLAKPALSQLSYIPEGLGGIRMARIDREPGAWWAWVDSNHPPHAYQACALTN